jgi:hypothetical protein
LAAVDAGPPPKKSRWATILIPALVFGVIVLDTLISWHQCVHHGLVRATTLSPNCCEFGRGHSDGRCCIPILISALGLSSRWEGHSTPWPSMHQQWACPSHRIGLPFFGQPPRLSQRLYKPPSRTLPPSSNFNLSARASLPCPRLVTVTASCHPSRGSSFTSTNS